MIRMVLVSTVLGVVGCSDASGGEDGAAGAAGGTRTVFISGAVTEFSADSTAPAVPIEGVEVCLDGSGVCTTTGDLGAYNLEIEGIENGFEGVLTFVKPGYLSVLRPGTLDTGEDDTAIVDVVMGADAVVGAFAAILNTTYPSNDFGISSITTSTVVDGQPSVPRRGVTYELVRGTGKRFFVTDAVLPDTSITETQAPGWGGFYEMSEGEVEIRFGGSATQCAVSIGWAGTTDDQIRIPVRNGFQTQAAVACPP